MRRGEVWWAELAAPAGRRPVLLLSRDEAYLVRELVTIAPLTTRVRQIPSEVPLGPGDGVYVPVHAPHWVTVPGNVAVSLSITFFTHASEDARVLHRVNGRLRRLGLKPSQIGRRPVADGEAKSSRPHR